jgi:hypothetical protein
MHVGDRQGHPFLAGTLIWRRSAKGSLKPTLSRATTLQLMPTTRNNERLAELTADPALRRVAVSPGAWGKWFVKSALSLATFDLIETIRPCNTSGIVTGSIQI